MLVPNNNVVAIITARGGSKGIPGKNIIDLAGKPLIQYTIDAALGSDNIDRTIVTSDDDEILRISQELGAEVIKRPPEISGDNAPSSAAISHVLEELALQETRVDTGIVLILTRPLRSCGQAMAQALLVCMNRSILL